VKRSAIINTIIGVLWIIGGVVALTGNMSLALFGLIPIPSILVILIGVVWAVLGIVALVRPQRAVAPAPQQQYYPVDQQQQYYPNDQPPQQYPPQLPQYAPRDPQES